MKQEKIDIEKLIEKYSNYIYKIIDNIIGNKLNYQDKEEIMSDTFYLLWKNQNKIKTNIKSYLSTIARNCSYEYLRKKGIEIEFSDELNFKSIKDYDQVLELKDKLSLLTKEEKVIFDLYYIEGYKIKEIAKKLRRYPSTIKTKLHRLRKKLKEN